MNTRVLSRGYLGIYRGSTRLRDKIFSVAISNAFSSFGRGTVLQLPIRLVGEERISLGSGIFIGAGSWLQTLDGCPGVALEIGDGTSIAGHCVISAALCVRIGRRVTIARGVYIADHSHAYERVDVAIKDQGIAGVAPVSIGDGAWIGENAVLSAGVRVGAGAVIGANAVVTTDIPPHTVAIGSPARAVRRFGEALPGPSRAAVSA